MPSLPERFRSSRAGQWGLAYVASAWLALQVVDILGDQFGWPLRLQQSITVILVFGLLVTMVLAWYHGQKGQQRFTATELTIIGSLLLICAGVLSVLRSPGEPERTLPRLRSDPGEIPLHVLAVLPFENLSGGHADDYLANGIHEDILTQLSGVGDLTVISRRSVLEYADTRKNIRRIAAELGARSMVEGSVRRSGDRLRVTVQLIDAATDEHVWARTYDLMMDDVFRIQSDVARQVAAALKARLTVAEARRMGRPAAIGLDAWELLQRARAVELASTKTRDRALQEEGLLREALAIDPRFALGWAQLAMNFAARPWEIGMEAFWADSALVAARRSIELDPDLALGYLAFGDVYQAQGFLDGAEENYTRAVELDPNLAAAHLALGRVASVRGRFDRAVAYLREALRRDPHRYGIRSEFGHAWAALGDTGAAERWFRAEIELRQRNEMSAQEVEAWGHWWAGRLDEAVATQSREVSSGPVARVGLAELSLMNGDPAAAAREVAEAVRTSSDPEHLAYLFFATTTLGTAFVESGDTAAAGPHFEASREKLLGQIDRGVQWPLTQLELAAVEDALGDRPRALSRARRAFDLGSRHDRLIELNPAFNGLREDPEFRRILERMKEDLARMRAKLVSEEQAAGLR